jgi:hypothetical protein
MIAESLAQFNAMRKGSADESEAKSRLMSSIESKHKDIVKEAFLAGFEAGRDSADNYITNELLDSAYKGYLEK